MIKSKFIRNKIIANRSFLILALLLIINLGIFILRNKGFDYKEFADAEQLNYLCNSGCQNSWSNGCYKFSKEEKTIAREILRKEIGLDTVSSDINKLIAINRFLYTSLCNGNRNKDFPLKINDPLKIFYYAKSNPDVDILCGRASIVNYLFCLSAGLSVRTIQVIQNPNSKLSPDSHVFNEVWIEQEGKWCYTDYYSNRMRVYVNKRPLATSEFFDSLNFDKTSAIVELKVSLSEGNPLLEHQVQPHDKYLNPNYFLAYFLKCDPKEIYTLKNRIKHYLLPISHYKIYKANGSNFQENFLFYLKEFFILLFLGYLFFHLLYYRR